MKLRVLVDTSTMVSALLRAGSGPERAVMKAMDACTLCVSAELLTELERTLAKPKLGKYAPSAACHAFAAMIRSNSQEFAVGEQDLARVTPRCRDGRDDFLLALAVAAEADVIVSSDRDLLEMHPWRGIRIVTPAQFLEMN